MDIIGGLALGGSILGSKDDINIKSKKNYLKKSKKSKRYL